MRRGLRGRRPLASISSESTPTLKRVTCCPPLSRNVHTRPFGRATVACARSDVVDSGWQEYQVAAPGARMARPRGRHHGDGRSRAGPTARIQRQIASRGPLGAGVSWSAALRPGTTADCGRSSWKIAFRRVLNEYGARPMPARRSARRPRWAARHFASGVRDTMPLPSLTVMIWFAGTF